MAEQIAYKVLTAEEFAELQRDQVFHGSPVDRADGFIHLSTAGQLAVTVDKHFQGQAGLMLAAVDLTRLGDAVHWEPSRGGALFPHIYAPLPMAAVVAAGKLTRGPDGGVNLPQ